MSRDYSEIEINEKAKSLIGKKFKEINKNSLNGNKYNKGTFGHIIEEDGYDYAINSISEPDFVEAGIELKVTPYKKNKDGSLSAKERLVLNIINFMEEYKNTFYESHFWYKNKKIQIVWYLYEPDKSKDDLVITHEKLFTFPEEDLDTIISDWNLIVDKIRKGQAHELSEADTMYLGACTKGANKNSKRKQPFSDIMAMQRAFCLKTSYMTQLVRKYIGNADDVERVLRTTNMTFYQFVDSVFQKYKNMSQKELIKLFEIDSKAKNINSILVSRMFGVNGLLSKTDEFLKANIVPKTVRVEEDGKIIASMSFPTFKYTELVNEDWENSEFRNLLETIKYMFFVFKKEKDDYIFKGIKLWNMPEQTIDNEVRKVWLKTKDVILNGNIVKWFDDKGRRVTNFPGMSENGVCHVRPHAQNAQDVYKLPVKDKITGLEEYTKHCFWINNKYIEEVLKDIVD